MGARGSISKTATKTGQTKNPRQRLSFSKPPFTIGDIKKVIPSHCFRRSLVCSFSYLVQDLILVFIFYYIGTTYFHLLPSSYYYIAWPIYWIAQVCVFTGLWMIGHECGHQAFSDYQWVNDTVGLILHSALLTPYFSWKYSHRRHNSNTSSIEHDEVHVPRLKSELRWFSKYLNNNPLGRVLGFACTLTLGWPLYLVFNASADLMAALQVTIIHMDQFIMIVRGYRSTFQMQVWLQLLMYCIAFLGTRSGLARMHLWGAPPNYEQLHSVNHLFAPYSLFSASL